MIKNNLKIHYEIKPSFTTRKIKELEQENKQLKDNWNKLKKWIYEEHCLYIPEIAKNSTYQLVFSKMQELELGRDSDE